mmetsp:Transcript_12196/g.32735  ORF Transcript_12196/g.32735 Transcript_12196/m.32735 type:complete len:356 (-) Transcript_12196:1196-2263(-)
MDDDGGRSEYRNSEWDRERECGYTVANVDCCCLSEEVPCLVNCGVLVEHGVAGEVRRDRPTHAIRSATGDAGAAAAAVRCLAVGGRRGGSRVPGGGAQRKPAGAGERGLRRGTCSGSGGPPIARRQPCPHGLAGRPRLRAWRQPCGDDGARAQWRLRAAAPRNWLRGVPAPPAPAPPVPVPPGAGAPAARAPPPQACAGVRPRRDLSRGARAVHGGRRGAWPGAPRPGPSALPGPRARRAARSQREGGSNPGPLAAARAGGTGGAARTSGRRRLRTRRRRLAACPALACHSSHLGPRWHRTEGGLSHRPGPSACPSCCCGSSFWTRGRSPAQTLAPSSPGASRARATRRARTGGA